jgi:hypothetical protein
LPTQPWAFREQLPGRLAANGVPDELAVSLTSGSGAVASEASTNVGNLGASILGALPEEARAVVEPFIGGTVAAMHEAFSLSTGTAFWLGIAAVAVAFVVLLPLRETPLPREKLAEMGGRSGATATPAPAGVPARP